MTRNRRHKPLPTRRIGEEPAGLAVSDGEFGDDQDYVGHPPDEIDELNEGEVPDFDKLKRTHVIRQGLFWIIEIHEMKNGYFFLESGQRWRRFRARDAALKASCDA